MTTEAYEHKLALVWRKNLQYLNENGKGRGPISPRCPQNTDVNKSLVDYARKKMSGAGSFTDLEDLEN